MTSAKGTEKRAIQRVAGLILVVVAAASLAGCAHARMMIGKGAKRPAATEFGLGPRTSAQGLYIATLEHDRPLRPRQMLAVRLNIVDADGQAIDAATFAIDGGMPQHGHGLPTRPRVTRTLGTGRYEIEGVRFNMGGWWEFKVAITTARGTDTVTFNLEL